MKLDQHGQPITKRICAARNATRDANELIGLCHGVLADGAINALEAQFIQRWLVQKRDLLDVWPWNALYDRISVMLQDGHLDSDEERELIGILAELAPPPAEPAQPEEPEQPRSTALPLTEPPEIIFPDKVFVFTGKFALGTRDQCIAETESRGGTASDRITRTVNYLIIGEIGSRDWATASWVRKIEHAQMLAQDGHPIHIVSEQFWAKHL